VKTFSNLTGVEDWLFNTAMRSSRGYENLYFPKTEPTSWKKIPEPSRIETRDSNDWSIWIHRIDSDNGIIFSDGKYTCGIKHWNNEVKEWLKHCDERKANPKFNFA
jgi:hypothetical protein